jgi:hypothetical protein
MGQDLDELAEVDASVRLRVGDAAENGWHFGEESMMTTSLRLGEEGIHNAVAQRVDGQLGNAQEVLAVEVATAWCGKCSKKAIPKCQKP